MAVDSQPNKFMILDGNCDTLLCAQMWYQNLVGVAKYYAFGLNRNWKTGTDWVVALGTHAAIENRPEMVEGRFGRRHESPRYYVTWSGTLFFAYGSGKAYGARLYVNSSPPTDTPWVLLQWSPERLAYDIPLTPPVDPLTFPLGPSINSWPDPGCPT